MNIRTPIGVLSFPVLFSPRPRAPGGEPVFSCSLLFDRAAQEEPEYKALRVAVHEAIDAKFGPGKSKDVDFMKGMHSPFHRCEEKPYNGYDIPGGTYITAWTKTKPGIITALRKDIDTPEDVWPGQLARLKVSPFAYHKSANRGVSFALAHVQICRSEGQPRLDGRRPAKEEFPDYVDTMAASTLVDDELPF
jgi:hypothetical protein